MGNRCRMLGYGLGLFGLHYVLVELIYGSDLRQIAYVVEWDSSADIVPEPSTYAALIGLLLTGGIGCFVRRRKGKPA